ncbi:MAG: putative membrane protein [Cenarchaeum symbiont of Oopsacas minuta]|nr:putative membrane protein [Cenarchaeum symbiont of Oopsacas minuta]
MDIFGMFAELSYAGVLAILVAVNTAPLLMPPTWIILSSFYILDPTFNPIYLALVGATGATVGRFMLKRLSGLFRRFVNVEQKSNLDYISCYLKNKKFGYAIASFLFAATPLPSNMLFVAYGLMRARSIGLYLGFWMGRVISYYIMISISQIVLHPFLELFEDKLVGILVADVVGVAVVVLFASIKWRILVKERKIQFTRPRIWKL